jgi:hypothetical protein
VALTEKPEKQFNIVSEKFNQGRQQEDIFAEGIRACT